MLRCSSMKAEVGKNDVDARVVLALGKGDAEIDHQPLPRILGTDTVEIGVHADLTETAQRDENELLFPVRPFTLPADVRHLPFFILRFQSVMSAISSLTTRHRQM